MKMSTLFITFSFAFSLFWVKKCEVVIFSRGHSAGVNGMPESNFGML